MAFQAFCAYCKQPFPFEVIISILVTCLLSPLTLCARLPDTIAQKDIWNIEEFAGDVSTCAKIPGLALGMVRGDAVFSTGLGVADMHTGHAVGANTIFNLGSTSKAFLPFLLAVLMKEPEYGDGRIAWDKPLKELLDTPSDLDLVEPWADLTLEEMLRYKSGSSAADFATMVGLPEHVSREGLIRRLQFMPDTKEFRESDHCSNHLYSVVSHVIERMTGSSWQDLMRSKVFSRLNMQSATFSPKGMKSDMGNTALPYKFHSWEADEPFDPLNKSLFDIHPSDPVGSIMVSATDMTKWMALLLDFLSKGDNSGNNARFTDAFKVAVLDDFPTERLHFKNDSKSDKGYGMGWISSSYRGFQRYKYSGHLYTYSSHIWLFPEVRTGIFLAINGPNTEQALRAIDGILFHVSDVLLGLKPWVSADIACCCQDEDDKDDDENYDYFYTDEKKPAEYRHVEYSKDKESYVGKYGNSLIGNMIVDMNRAGVLYMKLGRNLIGELLPGDIDSHLMLHTKGALEMTAEWSTEKQITFLYTTMDEGSKYEKVRVKLTNGMEYDFERDKLFETMTKVEELNAVLAKMKAEHRTNSYGEVEESTFDMKHKEESTMPHGKEGTTEARTPQPQITEFIHEVVTTETTTATSTTTTATTKPVSSETVTKERMQEKKENEVSEKEIDQSLSTVNSKEITDENHSLAENHKETTAHMKKEEEYPISKSEHEHEVLLQRDGNKSQQEQDPEDGDQTYFIKEPEYEGKSANVKKNENRSPSRGRLIRNHESEGENSGNSALGFHKNSLFSALCHQLIVVLFVIFWKRLFHW